MKVVVPMAGRGSRLSGAGHALPKPLIEVLGKPMVAWALESLNGLAYSQIVFVVLAEHERSFNVSGLLRQYVQAEMAVVQLPNVTEGQLCTVLAARQYLDSNEGLLIAASDTLVISELANELRGLAGDSHGLISVADLPGDQWSFARTNGAGRVVEVAEKVRISNHASTGLYYFSNCQEFLEVGDQMVRNKEKTRDEYYVIPVYQKYIDRGWRVDISVAPEVWDMGTPEALSEFEGHFAGGMRTSLAGC